jgi:copper chaperone
MKTTSMNIGGMSCEHCVKRVKKALEGAAGVVSAEVRVGTAVVTFDEAALSEDAIKKVVEKAGFTVS